MLKIFAYKNEAFREHFTFSGQYNIGWKLKTLYQVKIIDAIIHMGTDIIVNMSLFIRLFREGVIILIIYASNFFLFGRLFRCLWQNKPFDLMTIMFIKVFCTFWAFVYPVIVCSPFDLPTKPLVVFRKKNNYP